MRIGVWFLVSGALAAGALTAGAAQDQYNAYEVERASIGDYEYSSVYTSSEEEGAAGRSARGDEESTGDQSFDATYELERASIGEYDR